MRDHIALGQMFTYLRQHVRHQHAMWLLRGYPVITSTAITPIYIGLLFQGQFRMKSNTDQPVQVLGYLPIQLQTILALQV